MTNRTKELFEFAQLEPEKITDIAEQLQQLTEPERDHVRQVAHSVLEAFATTSNNIPDDGQIIDPR